MVKNCSEAIKKRVFDDFDILDEDTRSSGGASCISLDCHP